MNLSSKAKHPNSYKIDYVPTEIGPFVLWEKNKNIAEKRV